MLYSRNRQNVINLKKGKEREEKSVRLGFCAQILTLTHSFQSHRYICSDTIAKVKLKKIKINKTTVYLVAVSKCDDYTVTNLGKPFPNSSQGLGSGSRL